MVHGVGGPGARKIGVLGLASIAFYAVAGSPAGSEDAVGAAGPLLAMLGFLLMPFVWGVPESLVRHVHITIAVVVVFSFFRFLSNRPFILGVLCLCAMDFVVTATV